MSQPNYPFDRIFGVMKPCKLDLKRKPAHLERLEEIMDSTEYGFEEKIDGINGMLIGGRIFSNVISKKTGLPAEKTSHVPQISAPIIRLRSKVVLSGEIYYPGWKSSNVISITNGGVSRGIEMQYERSLELPKLILPPYVTPSCARTAPKPGFLRFICYDMLRTAEGEWLVPKPFSERREHLESYFQEVVWPQDMPYLDLNRIHYDKFQERLDEIIEAGREGGVLKKLDASYFPGKRPMWNQIKLKQELEDDVIITGYEPPNRIYTGTKLDTWEYWEDDEPVTALHARGWFGSMQISKYDRNGQLRMVGRVTGITDDLREEINNNKDKYLGRVIRIKAMERTETGAYRHANFVDFHPDKNARECRLEEND